MKLIAKKPCSFGGQQFYIDDEIPEELVANPATQERLGVIVIVSGEIPIRDSGAHFMGVELYDDNGTIQIVVKGEPDGENEQAMSIPATPEEIQKVFYIMQLTAEEGAKEIAGVESENVLILLHAADSRKTIKDAARKQADNLTSSESDQNESTNSNASTGTNTEGADT